MLGNVSRMLYFAYGSNMERVQLKRHCPKAKFVAAATLSDHELTFYGNSPMWGGGVAHLREKSGHQVEGVVWDIIESERKALDEYEGFPSLYLHQEIQVRTHSGKTLAVFTYIMANPGREMPPSKRYKQLLISGAEEHGLTDEYVDFLESIRPVT